MPSRNVLLKRLLPIILSGLIALFWLGASQSLSVSASPARPRLADPTPEAIPLDIPLRFDKLTIEDGLSQNAILSILQDSQGYLWIGTQDGLNRFDGYDFTVFKHEIHNPDSLSHNSILSMLEDSQGMLWFGTWGGGLNRYDPRSGQFVRYQHDTQNPDSLANDLVTVLYEDSARRLWIGTAGGLDELDRQTGKFIHHTSRPGDPHSLSSNVISSILEDPQGKLWIGTGGFSIEGAGLNYFDPQTDQVQRYQNDPADTHSLTSNTISSLLLAPDGALWVGTGGFYLSGNGLNRLDPRTGQVTRFQYDPQNPDSLRNDNVTSLFLDSNKVLWIGTWGGGLDRLDLSQTVAPEKERFFHTQHDPLEPQSLSADVVWPLFQDRSGVFWVGTINGGLNKLNLQVQRFRLYRNHAQDPNSLGFNVTGPFYETEDGKIWVGTWGGGLDSFDPQNGSFKHYVHDSNDSHSLPDNTIGSIYQDKEGNFWVGTLSGLTIFDPVTGQFKIYTHDPADPNSLSDNNISRIIEDKSGRLWIATLGGLDVYDRLQDDFTHIDLPEGVQPVALFIDRNETLWVGTWGQGLIGLDPDSLFGRSVSYTQYLHEPNTPGSLIDNAVWSIYEDQRGMLWVGTQSGLDRLDRFSDTFIHFPELDRLPNNSILCILDDADGNLWISTNNGLIRFNPLSGKSRKFDVSDGLQSNEFNSGACLRSRNGAMVFGGIDGFNLFDPADIQDNPVPPPVVVTAFNVFNNPVATDLSGKTPIDLNYRQNFISFDFAALDYHAPDRNRYQYKLDGVDTNWVDSGARRYASYTNLNGGDYLFRVRASNNDGVWNETGLAIPVRVTPPIWQTWWFQTGAVLLAIMLAVGGVGLRLGQVRAHNRQLEATVEQRTTALRHANERLEEEVLQRMRAEEELARRAAADLQQSEARFRAMFDSSSVGIGLLNLQRRLIDANPALCQMFGYSLDELLQIDYATLVYPDDVSADSDLFQGILA
ncbi:MAG: signal transduction histidine kinase, partial [Chloroflexi bacterium]|nr:signal transduction histidine kinase [Chloroflexota bacterium]